MHFEAKGSGQVGGVAVKQEVEKEMNGNENEKTQNNKKNGKEKCEIFGKDWKTSTKN